MIKIALTTAAVLSASATGASAYNGRHHAGIGRHGHVIGQGFFGRPHGGARAARRYQTFEIHRDATDNAYTRGYTVVR